MKKIATFEKTSFYIFREGLFDSVKKSNQNSRIKFVTSEFGFDSDKMEKAYESVCIPKRKTKGSAGYDFVCPIDVELNPGEEVVIPTGIRCRIDDGWVLKIYPRSGLGFKYRCRIANTIPIIDSDYYYSDNEGHILVDIVNEGNKKMILNTGDRFAQGIFVEFGITTDDETDGIRNGGFGSTGR